MTLDLRLPSCFLVKLRITLHPDFDDMRNGRICATDLYDVGRQDRPGLFEGFSEPGIPGLRPGREDKPLTDHKMVWMVLGMIVDDILLRYFLLHRHTPACEVLRYDYPAHTIAM